MKFAFLALQSLLVLHAAAEDDSCHSEDCTMSGPSMVQMSRAQSKKRAGNEKVVPVLVRYLNPEGEQSASRADVGGHPLNMRKLHTESLLLNETALAQLMADANVIVEEDYEKFETMVHHRGEAFSLHGRAETTPYGIAMVRSDFIPEGPHPVKVCVIDTGYDLSHPDLPHKDKQTEMDGMSPYSGQTWDADGQGHGTHCSGTIGAVGGNHQGVTSVNPTPEKFTFKIGKGLDDSGYGTGAGVMAAVDWCDVNGAKVISMSLGGGPPSQLEQDAFTDLWNDGILVIAAAGNGGHGGKSYPASYKHVVSVAAVDSNRNKAGFSQWNDRVGIAAPGVDVLSTLPGNTYASWSGTSMATPHVAGVAAKLWSNFPACTNKQIRNVLFATADGLSCNHELGFGIVDGEKAYQMLLNGGCAAGDFGVANEPDRICEALTPCQETGCDRSFHLYLKTDNYPGETTWEIRNDNGQLVHGGGAYTETGKDYHEEFLCLDAQAHTFTIYDAWGDGLCCGYGHGEYKLVVGGHVLKDGASFAHSETTNIPSARQATVTINTDNYPGETSWTLSNSQNRPILSGGPYQTQGQAHDHHYNCVDSGEYKFWIFDTYGDGICCGYGQGSYTVQVGDVVKSGGQFSQHESQTFPAV